MTLAVSQLEQNYQISLSGSELEKVYQGTLGADSLEAEYQKTLEKPEPEPLKPTPTWKADLAGMAEAALKVPAAEADVVVGTVAGIIHFLAEMPAKAAGFAMGIGPAEGLDVMHGIEVSRREQLRTIEEIVTRGADKATQYGHEVGTALNRLGVKYDPKTELGKRILDETFGRFERDVDELAQSVDYLTGNPYLSAAVSEGTKMAGMVAFFKGVNRVGGMGKPIMGEVPPTIPLTAAEVAKITSRRLMETVRRDLPVEEVVEAPTAPERPVEAKPVELPPEIEKPAEAVVEPWEMTRREFEEASAKRYVERKGDFSDTPARMVELMDEFTPISEYDALTQEEWFGKYTDYQTPVKEKVTIYRATSGNTIRPGDYVTNSKKYAELHLDAVLRGEGKVIKLDDVGLDELQPINPNEFKYVPKVYQKSSLTEVHEGLVKQAYARGEKIPPEVLAEYPELKSSPKLEGVLSDLEEKIDTTVEPPKTPAVGASIKTEVSRPLGKEYGFADPEIEARFKEAQKPRKDPFMGRVKQNITSLGHKITREFEHLPKTGEFAELRMGLLKLSKQKGVAADRALRTIQGITVRLNPRDYELFTRKVILDDLWEVAQEGKELPYGFTPETLEAELGTLTEAVEANSVVMEAIADRTRIWDALKADYITAMDRIGFDVSKKLSRKNYFRHQVLEYINLKGVFGAGKKLRTPTGRGFLKRRKGSALDINADYIQAEHEVMAQMLYDMEVAKTIKLVDKHHSIYRQLKAEHKRNLENTLKEIDGEDAIHRMVYGMQKNKIPMVAYENTLMAKIERLKPGTLEKRGLTDWHYLIPEGYDIWQPRAGSVFYMADSVPAALAEKIAESALEKIGVAPEQLRKVLAVGRRRRELVIKNEVAETLDNMLKERSTNPITQAHRSIIRAWKVWQLVSPRRYFKYNLRNLSGDADAMFAGNPGAFRKVPQAVNELYEVFFSDRALKGDLKDWFDRGGFASTLQAQEMGEFGELSIFKNIIDKGKEKPVRDIPTRSWKQYWKAARLSTDFRESVLRYAAYLDYLEQMRTSPNGMPKNFGASIPDEIRGMADVKDRSYMMANDLLGAYDRVGLMGQNLRDHVYPFWSWKEVNFRRYYRMFANAANEGRLGPTAARRLGTTAVKGGVGLTKWTLRATAFWAAVQAWNWTRFPEEEQKLPAHVRFRPHVILGTNKKGETITFTRIGALGDLLEWFGMDAAPQYIDGWFKGKMSMEDIAGDIAKSPLNIVVQGGVPFIKLGGELITRQSLFPEVTNPRTIRDRTLHLMRSFGLENEYLAISGKPSKPYRESLGKFFYYTYDPDQSAYGDIMAMKQKFMTKIGKGGYGFWITPRGNALYNARLALRYKDEDAAIKYMGKYIELGGEVEGIERSIKNFEPLFGLTDIEKNAFFLTLSPDDQERLARAYKYYHELRGVEAKKQ